MKKNALAAAETFTSNIAKEKYDKLGSSVSNESLKKSRVHKERNGRQVPSRLRRNWREKILRSKI